MRVLLILTAVLAVAAVCQALRIPKPVVAAARGRTPCTTDDGLDGVCRRRRHCPPARLQLTATETACPGRRRRPRQICCPLPFKGQNGNAGQPDVATAGPDVGTDPTAGGTGGGPAAPHQGGRFAQEPWLPLSFGGFSPGSASFGGFGGVSLGLGSSDGPGRPSLGSGGGLFFGVGLPGGSSGANPSNGAFGADTTRGSFNFGSSSGASHGSLFATVPPRVPDPVSFVPEPAKPSPVTSGSGFAGSGSGGSIFAGSGLPGNSFAGSGSPGSGFSGSGFTDSGFGGSSSTDIGFGGTGLPDSGFVESGITNSDASRGSSPSSVFAGSDTPVSGFAESGSTDSDSAESGSAGSGFAGNGATGSGFAEGGFTGSGLAGSGSTGSGSGGSNSPVDGFAVSGSIDGGVSGGASTDVPVESGSIVGGFAGNRPTDGDAGGSSSSNSGFAGNPPKDGSLTASGSPNSGFAGSGSTNDGVAESGSPEGRLFESGSSGGGSNSVSSGNSLAGGGFASSRPPKGGSSNTVASGGDRFNTGTASSGGSSASGDGSSGFASGNGFASGSTSRPSGGGAVPSGFAGSDSSNAGENSSGGSGFAGGGGSSGPDQSGPLSGRFELPENSSSAAPAAFPAECGRPTPKTVWLQAGQEPQERTALTFDIRVIGGKNAEIGKWPWIALIGHKQGSKPPFWFCGGTLIDEKNVLTAAHCLKPRAVNPATLVVRFGEYDTSSDDDGANPKDFGVAAFTNHQDFAFPVLHDDISLVHLDKPVIFTETIKPICLPNGPSGDYSGGRVDVAGWGYTEFGGESSSILQEVKLPVVPLPDCQAVYESSPSFKNQFPGGFSDKKLCAGEEEGGKDACQGDSGGPMVRELADGHYEQVGVVSAGVGCGRPGFPGVYTRVSAYLEWIQQNKK